MAIFKFYLQDVRKEVDEEYYLTYDNMTSELREANGDIVVPQDTYVEWDDAYKMTSGKRNLKKIKIQLGLKCNFSCEYCSQRFVPRNKDDHLDTSDQYHIGDDEVEAYVKKFDHITFADKPHFELWGGEPFLYWKTMKPLIEKLREKFSNSTFSVITNGSLLTDEIIDFIVKYDIRISVSHDGPGQPTRGPDPFDDPEQKKMLMKLTNKRAHAPIKHQRINPETGLEENATTYEARISFNSMVHKNNDSRADIAKWFLNKVGKVMIGEGGTVDAYDEGGKNMSWQTPEEHIGYRKKAISEVINHKTQSFHIQSQKIDNFIASLKSQRPASMLNQKCGMDEPDTIAMDMNGNVTTCQNVTATSSNTAGVSHKIGNIEDGDEGLAKIKINAGTHWSDRKDCTTCPVLQICQGSCLFLAPDSDLWDISCNNAFSDNTVWLAAALYQITDGKLLYRIEGPQNNTSEDRINIFGFESLENANSN